MESHVKTLGRLCILVGALGGLAGMVFFWFFAGSASIAIYGLVIGYLATGWFLLMLILMIPCIALGIGLLNLRPWSRSIGAVVAIFELLNFPLGTALGIYALWVLMSAETDALFNPRFQP